MPRAHALTNAIRAISLGATLLTGVVDTVHAEGAVDPLTVQTRSGLVRGVEDNGTVAFRGIPYAAAPIGARRWALPEPAKPWEGVRDAKAYGTGCPQVARYGLTEAGYDEDCLSINVTVPGALKPGAPKKPVIAWVYGGAFVGGSSALYPLAAMAKAGDAVVVSFNYRLGVFGFMGHPAFGRDHDGGYGLEDQRLALRWIQDNIAAFGGDPANVTVAGESAGAASICMHLVAPKETTGLFAKAIVQSAFCAQTLRAPAEADKIGRTVAEDVGCTGDDALACLRSKPVKELLEAAAKTAGNDVMTYVPMMGTQTIPEQPRAAFSSGRFVQVPFINGGNRDELRLYVAYDMQAGQTITPATYPALIGHVYGDKAARVLAEYPAANYSSAGAALGTAMTDFTPVNGLNYCGFLETARLASAHVSVFQYEFADRAAPPPIAGTPPMEMGAVHSSELPYQFPGFSNTTKLDSPPLAAPSQALASTMMSFWTSFSATSVPKAPNMPTWPRFRTPADTMRLEPGHVALFDAGAEHHCGFWRELYPELLGG